MTNTVTVTESNNAVTVTESNNTVEIVESSPAPTTPEPWYDGFSNVPSSAGSATATADTAAHTKGAWVEIIASNAADTSALLLYPSQTFQSGVNTATLVDIGVGASGAESVVAANIAIGGLSNQYALWTVIPVNIPTGTRVAARIQSVVTGGKTASIDLRTFAWGDVTTVPTTVDVLGTSTGTSAGTNVTTSYTEIVASTPQAYEAIVALPSVGTNTQSSATNKNLTVATGAGGSEVDVYELGYTAFSIELVSASATACFCADVSIPAGTRLSAKTLTATIDVTLIGIPAA